ncbi:hypothetical protein RYX36_031635, partial [Vicia faba]
EKEHFDSSVLIYTQSILQRLQYIFEMFSRCKCQSRLNFITRMDNICLSNVPSFLYLS